MINEYRKEIKMISLKKGEATVIKANQFVVGLGWDTKCDLDTHAYIYEDNSIECDEKSEKKGLFSKIFNSKAKIKEIEHIYYGHLTSMDNSVIHTGDNLTGEGGGDDEQIIVNLDLLDKKVNRICFKVNIFSGSSSFLDVEGAFIRIVDKRSNEELCRYNLTTAGLESREYTFGNLIKQNGEWLFKADE